MERKTRINDFLKSVAEAKGVNESAIIGGANKSTDGIMTTTNGVCTNPNEKACKGSKNTSCKNYTDQCNNSTNYVSCDNAYIPPQLGNPGCV